MSAVVTSDELAPLLDAMRALARGYEEARATAAALVSAAARGDLQAVKRCVAAQTANQRAITAAERERRRRAEELVALLNRRRSPGASERTSITCSELCDLLAPDVADELRRARLDLLAVVVQAQALNRQAAMLIASAGAVVERAVRVVMPDVVGYGPGGKLARPRADAGRRATRWA